MLEEKNSTKDYTDVIKTTVFYLDDIDQEKALEIPIQLQGVIL